MTELDTQFLRADARANLIADGVPEETVDELLDVVLDFSKRANDAVKDFELRGGQVIFAELNQPAESYPWENELQSTKDAYIRAFAAAVDFIDDETYDPLADE